MTTTDIVKADPDMPPSIIVADRPPTALLPSRDDLEAMALIAGQAVKATGMIPASIKTKEQALAILIAGWELGLRPMTALRHVYCVNGKTEIETRAMVGIIRARDKSIQFAWPEYTAEAVTCELSRPGQPVTRVRYTVADAKASGQMEKDGPWRRYTRDMLYAAATKRACRLGAPDLINAIEGAMQTEAEAVSLSMPDAQIRVLDQAEASGGIPASAFNDGDEGAMSVEVDPPAPPTPAERSAAVAPADGRKSNDGPNPKQRVVTLLKRAKGELDEPSLDLLNQALHAKFPALVDADGAMSLSAASLADAVAIGDFVATALDGRGPASEVIDGQATLV